jgi:hypothetical protein
MKEKIDGGVRRARPPKVSKTVTIPGVGTNQIEESTAGWTEAQWADYFQKTDISNDAQQKTASRTVGGTNLGARPMGVSKALDEARSELGRDKRTSRYYVPNTPTFAAQEPVEGLFGQILGAITRDQSAEVADRRQANAAMGLPMLGTGGVDKAGMVTQAIVDKTQSVSAQFLYRPALAALQGLDWAWENIVAEPLATVALATDKRNPAFEDGFQPGDVLSMWSYAREAANDASWGTAATANSWFLAASQSPLVRNMPNAGVIFGLVDVMMPVLENVDPWDPESIQAARDQYTAYNALTGAWDVGLNFLPIPAGKGVSAVRRISGLSTKLRESDRVVLRDDWARYKEWFTTDGAQGYETNIGKQIMEIADSKDVGFILERPLVKNMSGAAKGRLADLYAKTEDPEAVFDIFQASTGDTQAIQRLVDSGYADMAYAIGGVGDGIAGVLAGGGRYKPTANAKAYYDQAHRDAIERTEWSRALYKTFIADGVDEAGDAVASFTVLGDWMPMSGQGRILPSIAQKAASVVEDARIGAADMRAAMRTGNEEYLPAVADRIIQTTKGGPIVRLVSIRPGSLQWATANRPLNIVSFSGSRPDDAIEEAYAIINQATDLRFGGQIPVSRVVRPDGTDEIVYMSAAEFREQAIGEIAASMSKSGDATAAAFKALEDRIVKGMAISAGLSDEAAEKIVQGVRSKADESYESLRTDGYFLDDRNGMKVEFNPYTLRQLRESHYTLPINEIEAAFKSEAHHVLYRPAHMVGDGLRDAFDFGSTLFRTNMLLKPGYTFRNSILEPTVTNLIAHGALLLTPQGMGMFGKGLINFGKNNVRRVKRVTAGTVDAARSSRLTAKHRALADEYTKLMTLRDDLWAEIERDHILLPPSHAAQLQEVQDELAVIDQLLGLVTKDLVDAGLADAASALRAPTFTRLSTEVNDMMDVAKNPLSSTKVSDAESAALAAAGRNDEDMFNYWTARAEVLKEIEKIALAPGAARDDLVQSLTVLQKDMRGVAKQRKIVMDDPNNSHYERIELLNNRIDELQDGMLENRGKHALVKDRREKRAKPILQGEGQRTKRLVNGQEITVDEAFAGPFGSAYRADSSSAVTNTQAMNASAHNTTMLNMVMSRFRRGRTGTVSVTDPHYFEEIHYIASRHFAGDPLFQMIATKPKADVVAWAKTEDAKRYFKELGVNGKKYMKDIDEAYYVFNKLFPTKESRDLVTSGREFTTGELESALMATLPGGRRADLGDIVGQEIDYVVPSSTFHQAGSIYSRALDRIWNYIAVQPETRLARWPYYVRQFDEDLTGRMNTLAAQGVHVDLAVANAQRRASHVSTLANLEKTFYNIRRYKNPVFTARFMMAFPGAFANSIYRYGYYLPTRHPANMLTLMNVTNATFNSMSVDENGERVPFRDAKYLLLPGTGTPPGSNGITTDAGVRVPVDAITRVFLDNPGRSWVTAIGVDTALNMRPELSEMMNEYLPEYVNVFLQTEYGPQPGDAIDVVTGSLLANYQKTVIEWWRGTGSDKYLQDWGWAWQNVQAEKLRKLRKGDTSPVTLDEVNEVVDGWTRLRFLVQFASPTSYRVDAPGQMERDTWFRLREENPLMDFDDLREKYYEVLGGDADDPITASKRKDWAMPYTMSTSNDPYGMNNQYTLAALESVQKHENLASALGEVDPELVGLLAVGSGGSYNKAVYNNMAIEKPYDSASEAFRSKKMPQQYLTDWEIAEGWAEWSESKDRYETARKAAVKSGNRDYVNRLDTAWDFYRFNDDPDKGDLGIEVRRPEWAIKKSKTTTDEVGAVATALKMVREDESFMADRGSDEDWQSVWEMLGNRDLVLDRVRSLGSTDDEDAYKREIKEYFYNYYNEKSVENPLLMDLWDRYFASEFEQE